MFVELLILFFTVLAIYYYICQKKAQDFFKSKNVKYIPNSALFSLKMSEPMHVVDSITATYNAFADERYMGMINGTSPIMLIRDPEIIKNITVKHFDHFMDHKGFFPSADEIFGRGLFDMKGENWRDMRTTLSPAFTGSKMKMMLPIMVEVSMNVIKYLKENEGKSINVDDVMRRYANDVIASAGFGLQVNSFVDKNNRFYEIGQTLFTFNRKQKFIMFLHTHARFITEFFRIKVFPDSTANFFKHIVLSTMKNREENNVERPDMIQLLMEAYKGDLKANQSSEEGDLGFATTEEMLKPQGEGRKWSLEDLTAQVFLFFTAGFETTSSALIMAVHELALNQSVQEKLYAEIKAYRDTKKLSYESIGDLKYLDCVLNETLRKWSPAIFLDRMCVKSYELPPPREGAKPVRLNPGDVVYNMLNAIQTDPKYYPNPAVFDPERFSDENKHKIAPATFMPFGLGPRSCIGSRFALLELKVILYHLILNFKIVKCEKTMDPIRLDPSQFIIKALDGSWAKFESRQ